MMELLPATDAWTAACKCAKGHAELNELTRRNGLDEATYIFLIADQEYKQTNNKHVMICRKCVEERKKKLKNNNGHHLTR